jgi:hypothetical protein
LVSSFGCGLISSTRFSFGRVIVSGRRCTWVTRGGVGFGFDGAVLALCFCAGWATCGVGLFCFSGGSQTTASPALGGAWCRDFGWNSQIATSDRCRTTATIRAVRFGLCFP